MRTQWDSQRSCSIFEQNLRENFIARYLSSWVTEEQIQLPATAHVC